MGNETYYQNRAQKLHDVSKGRWVEMSKLLPLLLEFVNGNMETSWADYPPTSTLKFCLEGLLLDQSQATDEVFFLDVDELKRLFTWCRFLEAHNGAFRLYKPLVEALSNVVSSIAQYSPPDST